MVYKYKAMSAGTLNDPYRFIEQGAVIKSATPINASWLKPFGDEAEPMIPVLPVTSSVNYAGSMVEKSTIPPVAIPDAYALQMEKVIELEQKQDAVLGKAAAGAEASADAPVVAASEAVEGTGNQDVL